MSKGKDPYQPLSSLIVSLLEEFDREHLPIEKFFKRFSNR